MASMDPMSPDASPEQVSTRTGVRRVNNLPVYIAGGALAVFLTVMLMVAMDRAARQNQGADASTNKTGDTNVFAREIAGGRTDGLVGAAEPPVVPADEVVKIEARPDPDRSMQPRYPEPPAMEQRTPEDDIAERIAQTKRQQFEEAMRAKTALQYTAAPRGSSFALDPASPIPPRSAQETAARLAAIRQQAEAPNAADPVAAYQARVAQLRSMGIGGAAPTAGLTPAAAAAASSGNDVSQFANPGQGDRWRLDSAPEAPRTPFELRAGFVIPATLISGINAQLPGQIVAQVSQHVYDTATGKYLLVPQGARLVGAYSSHLVYGQSRVLVAWQRIVFPDGKAMDIGSMPGADAAGYAGFSDKVDNHYVRIFSSALLMSGVVAGVAYSQTREPSANGSYAAPTAGSTLSQALGQELGQVTSQMIAKNLAIAPTIEIRPGFRFNVVVVKDLTFTKPYRAFDY